jgi:outer membrane protein
MNTRVSRLVMIFGLVAGTASVASAAAASRETTPSPSLTLEAAVGQVLAQNTSLKEAEDAVAVIEARVGESRARLLPSVRGTLSYSRLAPLEEISIPDFGTFQLFPANNYDFHAGVSQLVYDFNRTKESVRLSESQVASAKDRLDLIRRNLAFQTARLFYGILFLKENIRVQEANVKILEDHLEVARKRLQAGTATELEALNTQVRIVSAQNQLVDFRNALDNQALALRRLMGLEAEAPLELEGSFTRQAEPLDAEELVQRALRQRPETAVIGDQIRTADIQVRLAGLWNRPSLGLSVLAGIKNGYIPNLNVLKLNYVAAVQANIPVFDGHLGSSMKSAAEAERRTLDDRTRDLEETIRTEVLQALADLKAARQKLESVEVNVVRAAKAVDYAKASYEAGTVTNLDVLDTTDAYAQAELIRLRAVYQFVLSRLALRRAVGEGATG